MLYKLDAYARDEKERWSQSGSWIIFSYSSPELGSGGRERGRGTWCVLLSTTPILQTFLWVRSALCGMIVC